MTRRTRDEAAEVAHLETTWGWDEPIQLFEGHTGGFIVDGDRHIVRTDTTEADLAALEEFGL